MLAAVCSFLARPEYITFIGTRFAFLCGVDNSYS
jgi:hypothetical protein